MGRPRKTPGYLPTDEGRPLCKCHDIPMNWAANKASPFGGYYQCRPRNRENCRKQRIKNPEQTAALVRKSVLKTKYGLTVADYDRMLAEQGGVCAICETPPTTQCLAVDHDHKTGRVRGLLCLSCNTLIGRFERHQSAFEAYLSVRI